MEPPGTARTEDVNKGEAAAEEEDKASERTPTTSVTVTPRRGLRERGAGRPRSGVSASVTDVNGAASSPQSSGRVLRDRSTRAVPAWLKDSRSDDDDDYEEEDEKEKEKEEPNPDTGASKRRKVSNSKRRKHSEAASSAEAGGRVAGDSLQGTDSEDPKKPATDAQALPTKRPPAQTRAKPPSGRAVRGSAKPVCKTEPGMENPAVKDEVKDKDKNEIKQKEKESEDVAVPGLDDEDPPFQDDLNDLSFQPQSQSGAEEEELGLSTDEDLPFRDDLNDQSYDPRAERDVPKAKRRPPPRQKEKKEKEKAPKKEREVAEIKIEGSENVEIVEEEVKLEEETVEDPDGPRKRGRRKKDDKTPRLPKRRKKPPVQYVRCEMEGCGTVLAHPRYLQHHIKYQHLLKKKYVCPHPSCGRLFRLQKQLLRHAKHHTDQRDYICEFCARAFKSSHNLAVHRMIHTGEKPLQCEICGFTCRQKASLNWHMKKHDADATYQFSCSICGKKFEKKDCVVAHKAKSHPEVLIAEALAANAGALITTPASLLELSGNPMQAEVTSLDVVQVGQDCEGDQLSQEGQVGQQLAQVSQMGHMTQQVSHQVVLLGQDQSLHTMQVPVTIALSPMDPPSPADNQQQTHLQLQMPVQFVQAAQQSHPQIQQLTLHSGSVVTQHQPQLQPLQSYSSQQQSHGQTQILQMTFQPVSQSQTHIQQIPILASSQQLQALHTAVQSPTLLSQSPASTNRDSFLLDNPVLSSSSQSVGSHHQTEDMEEDSVVWEQSGQEEVLSDSSEVHVQQVLL
ncbi:E3 ubiquitin-protein ligase ZFP91 isoform X2 [Labrus bergylta]|uniref:E3 ubiquitin-protein ligase ZFP91 isoform X2 n=1 Tax=Labrus bergylta TaxID=56723 RepID=UPI00331391C9